MCVCVCMCVCMCVCVCVMFAIIVICKGVDIWLNNNGVGFEVNITYEGNNSVTKEH